MVVTEDGFQGVFELGGGGIFTASLASTRTKAKKQTTDTKLTECNPLFELSTQANFE